jgi:hypothetical protein
MGRRIDGARAYVGRGNPASWHGFAAKVVTVRGNDCLWWTGAIGGRGDGGSGSDRHGPSPRTGIGSLCHQARRTGASGRSGGLLAGSPLADPRVPRTRARAPRDLARRNPTDVPLPLTGRAILSAMKARWGLRWRCPRMATQCSALPAIRDRVRGWGDLRTRRGRCRRGL